MYFLIDTSVRKEVFSPAETYQLVQLLYSLASTLNSFYFLRSAQGCVTELDLV